MLGHRRVFGSFCACLLVLAAAAPARADVTSWFSLEAGALRLRQPSQSDTAFTVMTDLGIGTSPGAPVAIGGLFKMMSFFGQGTDLALVARVADRGFSRGDWGFAVDVGPFQRWWGTNATGVVGLVTVGAPFGLQLSALYEEGNNDARTLGAVIGVDFMRLTVYRMSGRGWFPNPLPPAELRSAGGWSLAF